MLVKTIGDISGQAAARFGEADGVTSFDSLVAAGSKEARRDRARVSGPRHKAKVTCGEGREASYWPVRDS